MAELKNALEKYIVKLDTTIADSNIQFAVDFMYQTNIIVDDLEKSSDTSHNMRIFPPAPAIYS